MPKAHLDQGLNMAPQLLRRAYLSAASKPRLSTSSSLRCKLRSRIEPKDTVDLKIFRVSRRASHRLQKHS